MHKKISSYSVFFLLGTMLITSCSCSKKSTENTPKPIEDQTNQKVNPSDLLSKDSVNIYLGELSEKVKSTKSDGFTHKITKLENNTFAYSIFANGQLIIYQDVIPSRPTNLGFKNKDDAEKVAKLIEEKLRNGISPPTISEADLRGLGITE